VERHAKLDEVEIELRAQIEKARGAGVRISHLDTHMGALFMRPDLFELYLRLGIEHGLPVMLPKGAQAARIETLYPALKERRDAATKLLERNHLPVITSVAQFYEREDHSQRKQKLVAAIKKLPDGVSQIIVHCGVD